MSSGTKRSMLSDKRGSAPALWTDRPRNVSVSAAERRSINGMKWSDPETTCSIRRSLAVSPINYVTLEMRSLDKCHKADNPPAHARYSYAIIFQTAASTIFGLLPDFVLTIFVVSVSLSSRLLSFQLFSISYLRYYLVVPKFFLILYILVGLLALHFSHFSSVRNSFSSFSSMCQIKLLVKIS